MREQKISIWNYFIKSLPLTLLAMVLTAVVVFAATGTTDSAAVPGSTSSYTLESLYQRLANGVVGSSSTFTEPGVASGTGTMHTINDIMGVAPSAEVANFATTPEVLAGKTFWGLSYGEWGWQTGTMPIQSNVTGADGVSTFIIPDGYYASRTATAQDSDLVAGNFLATANIFGVDGGIAAGSDFTGADGVLSITIPIGIYSGNTATAVDANLAAANIRDGVNLFGVTGVYDGEGCPCSGTVVGDRWCDNGDGTVTDMTGHDIAGTIRGKCRVWLQDAACLGSAVWADVPNWTGAVILASSLYDGATDFDGGDCGLSDGSNLGDWRLPTYHELYAVTHGSYPVRHTAPRAFLDVQDGRYWSSSGSYDTAYAHTINMDYGGYDYRHKTLLFYVWAVRTGN